MQKTLLLFVLVILPSVAYLGAFAIFVAGAVALLRVPYDSVFDSLADRAWALHIMLVLSPVVGFIFGNWLAGIVRWVPMRAGGQRMMFRSKPAEFAFYLGHIVLVTVFCFYGVGTVFVGKQGMETWDASIGIWRFGLVYCFAAPVVSYPGALIVSEILARTVAAVKFHEE